MVSDTEAYWPRFRWDNKESLKHIKRYLTAIELAEPVHTDCCIDFGTGAGYGVWFLLNFYERVTGYDPKLGFNKESSMGTWTDELTKGWDIAYMIEVIEHIEPSEVPKTLADIGAKKLVISTPIRPKPTDDLLNHWHKHEYSDVELTELLRSCGYEVIKRHFEPVTWHTGEEGTQGFYVAEED